VKGSPDFEQFYISGFPKSTQFFRSSPLRLPVSPRPRTVEVYRLCAEFDQEDFRRLRSQGLRPFPSRVSFLGRSFMMGAIRDLRTLIAAASRLVFMCDA